MKKTLLAAALVTGFAGVAQAESSVTLYGLVDAGYGFQQLETKYRGAYENGKITQRDIGVYSGVLNGNRWGLKGTEDLGNGTSAIFVLESGFDLADGRSLQGGRLFGRQAYVGLTGESWGTFSIGRQYNAGEKFVSLIDPFSTGGGYAAVNTSFGNSVFDRYDSVIKYLSPSFGGFQFGIGVVHNDSETKYTGATAVRDSGEVRDYKIISREVGVSTGLGYTNGPLYVGASFDYIDKKYHDHSASLSDTSLHVHERHKTKAWNIGGTYDFDVVKLHLLYGGQADGSIGGTGMLAEAAWAGAAAYGVSNQNAGVFNGDGLKQHSWLAGLTAPVGDAGSLMFSYTGNTVKNTDVAPDVKIKSHNFGLGYRHSFSKRTSVYGVATYGWSEAKERHLVNGTGKVKVTATQAIIGLQHRF